MNISPRSRFTATPERMRALVAEGERIERREPGASPRRSPMATAMSATGRRCPAGRSEAAEHPEHRAFRPAAAMSVEDQHVGRRHQHEVDGERRSERDRSVQKPPTSRASSEAPSTIDRIAPRNAASGSVAKPEERAGVEDDRPPRPTEAPEDDAEQIGVGERVAA